MFNGLIIASVNPFNQGTEDKNGKAPVILNVISGACPNRNVISGTVAENIGLEVGKTYTLHVREVEPDPQHGRKFVYSKVGEISAVEVIKAAKDLPAASIFSVDEEVPASTTKSKKDEAFKKEETQK